MVASPVGGSSRWPRGWCRAIAVPELLLVHRIEMALIDAGERPARAQLWNPGRLGESLVPGTHVVADVAAEREALEAVGQRLRNGALLLDREIADAARRVEHVRLD